MGTSKNCSRSCEKLNRLVNENNVLKAELKKLRAAYETLKKQHELQTVIDQGVSDWISHLNTPIQLKDFNNATR